MVVGLRPICKTQRGSRKSTYDLEGVSAVDHGVRGTLEVLCQVEDDLRWVKSHGRVSKIMGRG